MEKKVLKKKDLSIVLNGGGLEMKGATIPVKWFFSEEVVSKEPRYILLIDMTRAEMESDESMYLGKRYLIKIEKGIKYLQVFKSGHHAMLALAIGCKEKALSFLRLNKNERYLHPVPVDVVKDGTVRKNISEKIIASDYVEFNVPKNVFASRPKSRLGKMWFQYVFWPSRPKPKDECQVKKITLLYSLPKLILLIMYNIFYLIYLPVAVLTVLFLGYQSIGPREIFIRLFKPFKYTNDWDAFVLGSALTQFRVIYNKGVATGRKIRFSPAFLTVFAASFVLTIYFMLDHANFAYNLAMSMLTFIFFVAFLVHFLKKYLSNKALAAISLFPVVAYASGVSIFFLLASKSVEHTTMLDWPIYFGILVVAILVGVFGSLIIFVEEIEAMTNRISRKKEKNYKKYLLANFIQKPDKEVDIKNLPDTFSISRKKRDLVVKFWSTKANVCRPYES